MQPLKALATAAATARQWLRSRASRWLPPSAATAATAGLESRPDEGDEGSEVRNPSILAEREGLVESEQQELHRPPASRPCDAAGSGSLLQSAKLDEQQDLLRAAKLREMIEQQSNPDEKIELEVKMEEQGDISQIDKLEQEQDRLQDEQRALLVLPDAPLGQLTPRIDEEEDDATIDRVVAKATKLVEASGGAGSAKLRRLLWKHHRSRSRITARVLDNLSDADTAIAFFRWSAASKPSGGAATFKHNTQTTNALLLTLIRLGQSSKAHHIFTKKMPPGCQPDRTTVSTVLYGLVDSGRLRSATRFCDEIKRAGILPFGKVLSVLIQALCNAGDVDAAIRIGRELTVDPSDFAFTYGILIHTLCKLRENSAAWSLFYELKAKGGAVDAQVYASLLHGLCKTGNLHKARALLDDMASRGLPLDAVVYNTLIHGFCKANKLPQALDLLQLMITDGFDASVVTYTTLIDALCKARQLDRAQDLLQTMSDSGCFPNVVTYTTLVDGLCKARRLRDAILVVKQMLSSGCEPDVVTYNSLIHGLCMANRTEEAETVLRELVRNGFVPNQITYSTLVVWSCRQRRLEQARELIREMILRGSVCHLVVYIDCIHGYCEARCQASSYECRDGKEAGEFFKMVEEMVVEGCRGGSIVFEGESLYDPMSRLERVEQITEFMFRKGCFGSEERYLNIVRGLSCIRKLKTPSLLHEHIANK